MLSDRTLIGWSVLWATIALTSYGVAAAIIPNPVFGRGIFPEPFAVAVWLVSAPLMGMVIATYFAPNPPSTSAPVELTDRTSGTVLGTIGGIAAFLAIGCPTCNKIALLLLGASGATSTFAPLQPAIGVLSLVLLAGTLAWRLRLRARGGTCTVPKGGAARG